MTLGLVGLLSACALTPTEEAAGQSSAALDETGTSRIRREVEVLSGARSEACAESLTAAGCRILQSPEERTFSRFASASSSQASLSRATAYVCERFAAAAGVGCDDENRAAGGIRVAMQRFRSNDRDQANIITTIPGTDAGAPSIILGAHHDSTTNDSSAPGAIDNASGIGILLEVVRALRANPNPPRRTVIVAAFAAEEGPTHAEGSDGSRYFVEALGCVANGDSPATSCAARHAAMINLDMLALPRMRRGANGQLVAFPEAARAADHVRLFARPGTEACSSAPAGDSPHQALGRSLSIMAPNSGLAVRTHTTSDRVTNGYARFSDHFSFHEVGIPAVRLIGPEAVDVAALNHTSLDRTSFNAGRYAMSERSEDQVIDWEYLSRAASLVVTVAQSLASGPSAPRLTGFDDRDPAHPRVEWAAAGERATARFVIALRGPANAAGEHAVAHTLYAAGDATSIEIPPGYRTVAIAAASADGTVGPLSSEMLLSRTCADLTPAACTSAFAIGCGGAP